MKRGVFRLRQTFICVLAVALCSGVPDAGRAASADDGAEPAAGDAAAANLTITNIWEMADEHHPRLLQARAELRNLEREVVQREAAYAPVLTVQSQGLSLGLQDGTVETGSPGLRVSSALSWPSGLSASASLRAQTDADKNPTGSISLSQSLLRSSDLSSDAMALRQSRLNLLSAEHSLSALENEVRAEVLAALYAYQMAVERLELAQASYVDAEQAYGQVEEKVAVGSAGESDRLTAEITLRRGELDVLTAESKYKTAMESLRGMLGPRAAAAMHRLPPVLNLDTLPDPGNIDEAVARAGAASPAVRDRAATVETARLQLTSAEEELRPEAALSLAYATPGVSGGQRRGWSVGLEVSYPLADGGTRARAVAGREAALEQTLVVYEQELQRVQDQVTNLFNQLDAAKREVALQRLEVRLAELELQGLQRQAALPVSSVAAEDVAAGERAVQRAGFALQDAIHRYQGLWLELQILQGPVPWHELLQIGIQLPGKS